MFNPKAILLAITFVAGLSGGTAAWAAPPAWVEQGPGPILNAPGVQGLAGPNPAAGAINAIAADPTTADIVFVGTVNGGVWKTANATAASPIWTPLTDQQLPALSINSLAMSPVDPNTVFAGTGSTSSDAFLGSPGFGVARTTDGGATWTVLAAATFTGRRIDSIVPTTLSGGKVVLAATLRGSLAGVYRSADKGVSFARISGNGTSGLPDAGVGKLIADPGNANRFYAGVPRNFGGDAAAGVYRSDDGGVTWTAFNTGLTGLATSFRILLSVHNDATNNVVYAAVINTSGTLSGVFRSTNQGGSWTSLGVPAPPIFPGEQGNIHGALAADPSNPSVVFIAGDTQDGPFTNANGCTRFTANVFRYTGTAWENVVCDGARETSPHADSRDMRFDADGNLLQANDGGIYRLLNPNSAAAMRQWVPVVGNIRPTEIHSVAFDPLSKVTFGGTQDNGTPIQSTQGGFTWSGFVGGDGGVVAVDGDQVAHPGTSLRYSSSQFFGNFNRSTWNAKNTFGGFEFVGLLIVSGPGTGKTLFEFDDKIQFYNPYVLNAIDPSRMLIGTENIYESLNHGDSLANLVSTGQLISDDSGFGQPLAYGGRLNGRPNADVFYVGAGATIYHRVRVSEPIVTLNAYPGSTVHTIVMNPQNYRQVFVADSLNRVWGSFDEGASWIDLTANLPSLTSQVTTIEVVSPGTAPGRTVLIAGGFGVFQLRNPAGGVEEGWQEIIDEPSRTIPNALIQDLHYDPTNNVLVAGTLGRGSWTLSRFIRGSDAIAGNPPVSQPSATVSQTAVSQPSGSVNISSPPDLPPSPSVTKPATPDSP